MKISTIFHQIAMPCLIVDHSLDYIGWCLLRLSYFEKGLSFSIYTYIERIIISLI